MIKIKLKNGLYNFGDINWNVHGLNCVFFLEMELQERFLVVNFPALLGAVAFSSIGVQSIINGWKWRVGGM